MAKPLRIVVGIVLVIGILSCTLYILLRQPLTVEEKTDVLHLCNRSIMEIERIEIENQHDAYAVWQEEGGFLIHGIPVKVVNDEYLRMLLEECSVIEYLSVANEDPYDLSLYGLDKPMAKVNIKYTDETVLTLEIGNEEPVSGGQYFMVTGENRVLLMKHNRSIRFTMPLTNYIKYVIISPCNFNSPLSIVKDITFSGTSLPEPIVIEAVDEKNAQHMRDAASFGVATHLVRSPGLHEIDQTEAVKVFNSLMGLVSEGVVDYNCTKEQLNVYGFDNPWLKVEFDYQNKGEVNPTHVVLRVVQHEGGLIAIRDDEGVVYRILDVEFTKIKYENIVMRWFLTPFITDLASMKINFDDKNYHFIFSGDSNRTLAVKLSERELDIDAFRTYYTLIISAENDGEQLQSPKVDGEPLITVEFTYRDKQKTKDTMRLYKGNMRRAFVEINGMMEFAMRQNYVECIKQATVALLNKEAFSVQW